MDYWAQLRKFKRALNIEYEKIITPNLLEEMKVGKVIMYKSWEVRLVKDLTEEEKDEYRKILKKRFGFTDQPTKENEPIMIPKSSMGWRLEFGPTGIPFFRGAKLECVEGYILSFDLPLTEEEEKHFQENLNAFFYGHEIH